MVPLGSLYHPDLKILTVLFQNFLTSLSHIIVYITTKLFAEMKMTLLILKDALCINPIKIPVTFNHLD